MSDKPRPEGCRFWVAEDVVEWITANVPDKNAPDGSEAAMLWWRANAEAMCLYDLNTRELAELVLEGFGGIEPDDITEDLQQRHEDDGNVVSVDEGVEANLREFFGLTQKPLVTEPIDDLEVEG